MARSLQIIGSDILREISRELDVSSEMDFIRTLLMDMKIILKHHDGMGLAAPQAGEAVRLFILASEDPSLEGHRIFINPIIETRGELLKYEEGCLSIPGIYESFKRPEFVSLKALDIDGKQFEIDAGGLISRAIQHENDHLNGILFIDHLSTLKRQLLRRKISDINKSGESGSPF